MLVVIYLLSLSAFQLKTAGHAHLQRERVEGIKEAIVTESVTCKICKLPSSFPFAVLYFRNLAQLLVFSIRLTVKIKIERKIVAESERGGEEEGSTIFIL